ncbi:MAG: class I tRNA ligase family protein, partial [Muribaculaceae bacterium]|nr:class I tRNA ligase family protein [Muribaculaceae bacterium]
SEAQIPLAERPEIDRWILSLLNSLVKEVETALDDYEPTRAARAINDFVGDNLSNWYVRLNRKRFWGGEMTADKLSAYQTLYQCLETIAVLMAPIAPFYADKLYLDLTSVTRGDDAPASVHLTLFPEIDESAIDKDLEERMSYAQQITSMVLALRRKASIKVRQPLGKILLPLSDDSVRSVIEPIVPLILNEVNVHELEMLGSDVAFLVKRVKPDFKKLGPRFGKRMKSVAAAIQALPQPDIARLERDGSITLVVDGDDAVVPATDVEIFSEDIPGWLVANEGSLTVALDITVTPELRKEGIARELVNRIQNIRKSRDYSITDRIDITIASSPETDGAVEQFRSYISDQVLATSLTIGEPVAAEAENLDMDGTMVTLSIVRHAD